MIRLLFYILSLPLKIVYYTYFYFIKFIKTIIVFVIKLFSKQSLLSIQEIDELDGLSFEKETKIILENNGYSNVKVTQGSGDFGIDVLANKHGKKYAIQCKLYSNSVGVDAVQQAESGCRYYNYDIPVVLTNNYFTKQAKELANNNGVILWDRDDLNKMLSTINFKRNKKKNSTIVVHDNKKQNFLNRFNNLEIPESEKQYSKYIYELLKLDSIITTGKIQRNLSLSYKVASSVFDFLKKYKLIEISESTNYILVTKDSDECLDILKRNLSV